jgi:DNA-binding transcriptional LysR family regulator
MMDWDKLRVFHAVAQAGSFTHAGEALGLSPSSISRQIAALEESLHVSLFHRHARGLQLTEQGNTLYEVAKDVFSKLAMAETMVSEARDKPSGPLRVTTPVGFGSTWLTERLREFIERYPDIELTVVVSEDELDISMREADVAVRIGKPQQPDLVQRKLITMSQAAFAAPDYLRRHGTPHALRDLDQHQLIAYDETLHLPFSNMNWLLDAGRRDGVRRRPVLRVNNIYGIFRAAASGLGIASLPGYMARANSDLVPVLPDSHGPEFDLYLAYPEELRNSKRIGVFRDFIVQKIGEMRN